MSVTLLVGPSPVWRERRIRSHKVAVVFSKWGQIPQGPLVTSQSDLNKKKCLNVAWWTHGTHDTHESSLKRKTIDLYDFFLHMLTKKIIWSKQVKDKLFFFHFKHTIIEGKFHVTFCFESTWAHDNGLVSSFPPLFISVQFPNCDILSIFFFFTLKTQPCTI